ncbi:hypothetical protein FSOLCH5_003694 [Fusarium solani]
MDFLADFLASGVWVSPLFKAILVGFVWPNDLYFSILQFLVWSPIASINICANIFLRVSSGFVDKLYLKYDPEYYPSIASFGIFAGTLLARGLVILAWRITKLVVYHSWNHFPVIILTSLFIRTSWWYIPTAWRGKPKVLLDAITLWPIMGLTALMYAAVVAAASVWRHTATAVRSINQTIWTSTAPYQNKFAGVPPLAAFDYSSLPDFDPATEIRLLKLHRKFPFLQLSAELVSWPLHSAPPYHAISYVWAHGPQDMRHMTLNGMWFRVRGNVHDILVNCSSVFGPRFVWIDTICIDQGNLTEKTVQVRAMQNIYSKAAHVLICLGGTWSLPALSLVGELQTLDRLWGRDYVHGHVSGFFQRRRIDPYLCTRVKALVDLMQHPWFSRVWVVQEAVVASRATFFYGGTPIPLMDLYGWQTILCDGQVLTPLAAFVSGPGESPQSGVSEILGFLSLSFIVAYRMELAMLGPAHLSHVLRVFGEKHATMHQDKVFALIGMAKESSDATLKQLIDYSRPAEDVLLDLGNYLVDVGQALDVFDLAGLRQRGRNPSLPSWAVDWTAIRAGMPLNSTFQPSERQYHAARDMPARVRRGSSRHEIVVRGQYVDRIAWLLPLPERWWSVDASNAVEFFTYAEAALSLAREHVLDPYQHWESGQPLAEAVWRTTIGDKTHSARPAPASCGQSMSRLSGLIRDAHGRFGLDTLRYTPAEAQARLGVTEEQRMEIQNALHEFQGIELLYDSGKGNSPLVFCVTERGYIGMVPHVSEVNDSLCLIHGVNVPCVLRVLEEGCGIPGKTKYRLLGDSYIHGIMDGEALSQVGEADFVLV